MVNTRFEAYKLEREIKRSGTPFEFSRRTLNEFDEPTNLENLINITIPLWGLYHEQNSNVQIVTGDTTQIRNKKVPMILCLYKDFDVKKLKVGDLTRINGKILKVTGLVNIMEWNLIIDISLEAIDYGIQAEV